METHKIEFYPSRGTGAEEKRIYKLLGQAWPIQPIINFKPDWYKNLGRTYQHHSSQGMKTHPTAKSCPGIFDYMRAGYIVPMWCDIQFKFSEENNKRCDIAVTETIYKNVPNLVRQHEYQQVKDAPFLEGGCSTLVKLNSPWYVNVPKGVSLLIASPFYHINNDFTVIPGIIDADLEHLPNKEVNCFIKLNKPNVTIKLNQGQPLLQIIPFVRTDYEFENNVPLEIEGEQELDIMNIKFKTKMVDQEHDPIKKLQTNRTPKNYNVKQG